MTSPTGTQVATRSKHRPSWQALTGALGADWDRERRASLFFIAACTLAVAPHLLAVPIPFAAAMLVFLGWRIVLWWRGEPMPARWLVGSLAVGTVAGVWGWYGTLLGREPGVAMLAVLTTMKMLELHAKRDQIVVVALGLFSSLAVFLHTSTPWAFCCALLATLLLLAALRNLASGQHAAPLAIQLRTTAVLLVQAIPFALVMFALFPRLPAAPWGQDEHGNPKTGMSETMSPGAFGKLIESDKLAITVRFRGMIPPQDQLYWRGPVLGHYDGRTWRPLQERSGRPPTTLRVQPGHHPVRYQAIVEPNPLHYLYALESPAQHGSPQVQTAVTPDLQVVTYEPIDAPLRVDGMAFLVANWGLNLPQQHLREWLQLPAGFNPRTLTWAAKLRDELNANSIEDNPRLVQHLLRHFREQPYRYTFEPPKLGQHAVDEFLFDTRAGFCEHYASAFVVMMRALDIPARVVTGYQGGEPGADDQHWYVRQRDAHAWAEVWLHDQGWVRVDPTAAVAPERIDRGSRSLQRQAADSERWSWLENAAKTAQAWWNGWVHGFDASRQRSLLKLLGLNTDSTANIAQVFIAALLITLTLTAAWLLRPTRARKDRAGRLYERWCKQLKRQGMGRDDHETPAAYAARIAARLPAAQASQALEIAARFGRIRYDPGCDALAETRRLALLIRDFSLP